MAEPVSRATSPRTTAPLEVEPDVVPPKSAPVQVAALADAPPQAPAPLAATIRALTPPVSSAPTADQDALTAVRTAMNAAVRFQGRSGETPEDWASRLANHLKTTWRPFSERLSTPTADRLAPALASRLAKALADTAPASLSPEQRTRLASFIVTTARDHAKAPSANNADEATATAASAEAVRQLSAQGTDEAYDTRLARSLASSPAAAFDDLKTRLSLIDRAWPSMKDAQRSTYSAAAERWLRAAGEASSAAPKQYEAFLTDLATSEFAAKAELSPVPTGGDGFLLVDEGAATAVAPTLSPTWSLASSIRFGVRSPFDGSSVIAAKAGIVYERDSLATAQPLQVVAQRELSRRDFVASTGFAGDPFDLDAVRGAMQRVVDNGASERQVAKVWSEYLSGYYVHGGDGFIKPTGYSDEAVAPHLRDYLHNALRLVSGQRVVNCVGYDALTNDVLGALRQNGQPRYDTGSVAVLGHAVASLRNRASQERLVTSNDMAATFPAATSDAQVAAWIANGGDASRGVVDVQMPGTSPGAIVFTTGTDHLSAHGALSNFRGARLSSSARIARADGTERPLDIADRAAYAAWIELQRPSDKPYMFASPWETARS